MAKKKIDLTPAILILPAFILVVCVIIYPIISAVVTSFRYYRLTDILNTKFIGFDNYIKVWSDDAFIASLPNTFKWVAATVISQFIIGLTLALFLNRPFKGSYRRRRGVY